MQLLKNVHNAGVVYMRDGALQVDRLPADSTVIVLDDSAPATAEPNTLGGCSAQREVAENPRSRSVTTPVREAAVAVVPGPAVQMAGSGGNVKAVPKTPPAAGSIRSKIISALTSTGRTVAEIADAAGVERKRCGIELCALAKDGLAARSAPGFYRLPGVDVAAMDDAPPQPPEALADGPSDAQDAIAAIPQFALPKGSVRTVTFGAPLK